MQMRQPRLELVLVTISMQHGGLPLCQCKLVLGQPGCCCRCERGAVCCCRRRRQPPAPARPANLHHCTELLTPVSTTACSGASGYLLPLSGGADSSCTAAIVGAMSQMVVRAAAKGDAQVAADAHRCMKTFGHSLKPYFLQAHTPALALMRQWQAAGWSVSTAILLSA